ncbi:HalOD1 output domain-containing protein [Natrialba asiatica]|uniref:Halobacterial output domain-containing protein n=1 Tax=Natrialba asiatica (strain ATCC 700177 / DSM 12278 / JCM 9576 / FERM P-10747 / NBRC 102637 / 172P1) TaxID=29540 RepID=M0AT95_NATA1|nr:HalOD1 output domain-containing protein [Natrialba asiatica]ELZ01775.1 hypothetical protein C481_09652 [Natrialba asiatica DSM 12278]
MQTDCSPADDAADRQYDQPNDRYVFHHDTESSALVTTTIVHALASVTDIDVSQGEFSLYDSVDPDALNRLFRSTADGSERSGGHVAFTAVEHTVYVYANGDVVIHPPTETDPGVEQPRPHPNSQQR